MKLSRPVAARATRMALMVASVPELTMRTISSAGTMEHSRSAISTSAGHGAPKLRPRAAAACTAATMSGVRVAGDHRAPGAHVVDVFAAFDIVQAGALGALEEHRVAADAIEGADRRIDAAGMWTRARVVMA
jgi:hypothetical protein